MRTWPLLVLMMACWSPAPESAPPVHYVVVRGDTLGKIADAHGVSVDALRTANGLTGDLIEVDQVLVIPAGRGAVAKPVVRSKKGRRSKSAKAPTSADGLVMPQPKPCLSGPDPSQLSDDEAMVGSQGLTTSEIKAAIGAFTPHTASCLSEDFRGTATVMLDITIGCDGLVDDATIIEDGGLPNDTVACISRRVHFAPFPAHDLPLGEQVRVPMHYRYLPPPEGE